RERRPDPRALRRQALDAARRRPERDRVRGAEGVAARTGGVARRAGAEARRGRPSRRRPAAARAARRARRRPARRGDRAPRQRDHEDPGRVRRPGDPRRPRHEPGLRLLRHDRGRRLREADRLRPDRRGSARRAGDARVSRDGGGSDRGGTRGVSDGPSLKIEGLSVPRGGHQVLHGISLEVPPGAVTTLLGPNGAGKSTLVLAVAGVLRPSAGGVSLDGRNLTRLRPELIRKAGVAVVPEGRRLLPELTVEDNMRVATYALGREQARQGIEYAIE